MALLSDCGGTCVRTIHEIGVRLTFSALASVRHLRLRDEHLRLRIAVEPVALDVGRRCRRSAARFRLANSRITPLPMTSRSVSGSPFGQYCFAIASLMIDDRRRGARVALVERPAALDRNLEHLEVAGRDRHPAAAAVKRPLAVGGERPPDDAEGQAVAALQRHAAGGARVRPRRESPSASRRRCARPARPLPPCRTARPSATSSASGRCACRSRDRRGRAPSRSG